MKISCCILTYNEAERIHIALGHAFKWADEVVVVDKGSTDDTREIAEKAGAKVHVINFSRQGHEDMAQFASFAENEWIWGFTPGEVPTRGMIELGKKTIEGEVDAVVIPHKYYSFGVHFPGSPWSFSGQLRLYNRKRVRFTGRAHGPIEAERLVKLEPTESCYVLHQTHVSAPEFMRAHADYMINEANSGTPMDVMQRVHLMLTHYDPVFKANPQLRMQAYGWAIYWMGVALHALERDRPSIKDEYKARAETMLKEVWA